MFKRGSDAPRSIYKAQYNGYNFTIGAKRATILNPNTMKTEKKHNEKREVKDVDR